MRITEGLKIGLTLDFGGCYFALRNSRGKNHDLADQKADRADHGTSGKTLQSGIPGSGAGHQAQQQTLPWRFQVSAERRGIRELEITTCVFKLERHLSRWPLRGRREGKKGALAISFTGTPTWGIMMQRDIGASPISCLAFSAGGAITKDLVASQQEMRIRNREVHR